MDAGVLQSKGSQPSRVYSVLGASQSTPFGLTPPYPGAQEADTYVPPQRHVRIVDSRGTHKEGRVEFHFSDYAIH